MAALGRYLRTLQDNRLAFWCPGCNAPHQIAHGAGKGPRWGWNGRSDAPTFTPSVLVTYHANPDAANEFAEWRVARRCHTFVTDGRIQYLGDCTHALAGQTINMVAWPRPDWNDGDDT